MLRLRPENGFEHIDSVAAAHEGENDTEDGEAEGEAAEERRPVVGRRQQRLGGRRAVADGHQAQHHHLAGRPKRHVKCLR